MQSKGQPVNKDQTATTKAVLSGITQIGQYYAKVFQCMLKAV